jgi:hypothetical protein
VNFTYRLGEEWGGEPDKTLPAPFLRWLAEINGLEAAQLTALQAAA